MGSGVALRVKHIPQPLNECGSTSLLQVLSYYGSTVSLKQIMREAKSANKLGDWDYRLGTFALQQGFKVTIFDNNLYLYDATWFGLSPDDLVEKIHQRYVHIKKTNNGEFAGKGWQLPALAAVEEFLKTGGHVNFAPLSKELIISYLDSGVPLICSLSIEYLYNTSRTYNDKLDDVRGISYGHFVTIVGHEAENFLVLDPERKGVFSSVQRIPMAVLINAILRRRDGTLIAVERH